MWRFSVRGFDHECMGQRSGHENMATVVRCLMQRGVRLAEGSGKKATFQVKKCILGNSVFALSIEVCQLHQSKPGNIFDKISSRGKKSIFSAKNAQVRTFFAERPSTFFLF